MHDAADVKAIASASDFHVLLLPDALLFVTVVVLDKILEFVGGGAAVARTGVVALVTGFVLVFEQGLSQFSGSFVMTVLIAMAALEAFIWLCLQSAHVTVVVIDVQGGVETHLRLFSTLELGVGLTNEV